MNDIAVTALRVGEGVRARVRRRPSIALAVSGFVVAAIIVVAGGRVGPPKTVIPLTSWFGLLPRNERGGGYLPGALMMGGIAALLLLWIVAIRLYRDGQVPERKVWAIATAWATPFVLGPPLLSNDVFSYAAQGLLLRKGLDPYTVGPSALGNVRAVAAVDPSWRSVPSPYGPLATTLQHLAVAISGGNPLGAALVFRGLGVVCLVAIGLLAADLAGPRRSQALTITILNPLLLLHVVSAAHLDGAMCAVVLGAIVAANQRKWALSIVLAVAAGAIKAPAFMVVLPIIAVHLHGLPRRSAVRVASRDLAVAAAGTTVVSLIVPDGWGWIHALNTPALGHTALAPASLLADLIRPIITSASFDDLAAGGRITAFVAAGFIALYLTVTAQTRALNRTAGYGLLAIGVLSPVVYPWYLLGGIVCLAPTARAERRDWIILISAISCLLSPPGFSIDISTVLSVIVIAVALAAMGVSLLKRRRGPVDDPAPTAARPAVASTPPVPVAMPAFSGVD